MSNDYIDYNNEEVSYYTRKKDPREIDQVSRLEELRNYKVPRVQDDTVTFNQMTLSQTTIINVSNSTDEEIKEVISDIKDKLDDTDISDDIIVIEETTE